jgi:hypothetical protein
VVRLREYSNYLAPKFGFLTADTWTLAVTYLRNLLVNCCCSCHSWWRSFRCRTSRWRSRPFHRQRRRATGRALSLFTASCLPVFTAISD